MVLVKFIKTNCTYILVLYARYIRSVLLHTLSLEIVAKIKRKLKLNVYNLIVKEAFEFQTL